MVTNVQSIGKTLMNVFMPDQAQSLRAGETQAGGEGTPAATTGSSFQDIFQLIDANSDLKLGTDELKIMSHLFVEGIMLAKDKDGDGALSAEEAGVSDSLLAEVDTNHDNKIDSSELGSMTDDMLNSIIQALDKDQDKALSVKELALLFFVFGSSNTSSSVAPAEETQAAERQTLRKVPS